MRKLLMKLSPKPLLYNLVNLGRLLNFPLSPVLNVFMSLIFNNVDFVPPKARLYIIRFRCMGHSEIIATS